MELVSGLHHVSMKCRPGEEYGRVRAFYSDVLGMAVSREWADGILFDTGDGSLVEIFTADDDLLPKGTIRHFALATMDADACADAVSAAGYEVFSGPRDIVIPSDPALLARIAFCRGPLGEEIELFQER